MITCTCGEPASVQWKRRPTLAEADQLSHGADPGDSYIPVYACADHALTPDAAVLMHQAVCSGPGKTAACDCTPEPLPEPDLEGDPSKPADPERPLPPGW
ncbi:hypothetical protein AB0D97_12420 [Streptomyces roseus]|uniref:hypothetical protein n=1 Tax=Streptomyces roseus TaxID=66430 RepID=UPI0033C4AE60